MANINLLLKPFTIGDLELKNRIGAARLFFSLQCCLECERMSNRSTVHFSPKQSTSLLVVFSFRLCAARPQ